MRRRASQPQRTSCGLSQRSSWPLQQRLSELRHRADELSDALKTRIRYTAEKHEVRALFCHVDSNVLKSSWNRAAAGLLITVLLLHQDGRRWKGSLSGFTRLKRSVHLYWSLDVSVSLCSAACCALVCRTSSPARALEFVATPVLREADSQWVHFLNLYADFISEETKRKWKWSRQMDQESRFWKKVLTFCWGRPLLLYAI